MAVVWPRLRRWRRGHGQAEFPGIKVDEARGFQTTGLAGRYAAALFDLALAEGKVEAVSKGLGVVGDALAGSGDLRALVVDRLVSRADLGRALAAVARELKLPPLVANFLGVLAENGRTAILSDVISAFRARVAAWKGEATAQVIAAHKLTKAQEKAIATKLKARTGRDMTLDVQVDPTILGGLVVRIGSEQIDSSVKTRLDRLGARMKGL
jgi:F-type H+-transporting ATPase subunit delta